MSYYYTLSMQKTSFFYRKMSCPVKQRCLWHDISRVFQILRNIYIFEASNINNCESYSKYIIFPNINCYNNRFLECYNKLKHIFLEAYVEIKRNFNFILTFFK